MVSTTLSYNQNSNRRNNVASQGLYEPKHTAVELPMIGAARMAWNRGRSILSHHGPRFPAFPKSDSKISEALHSTLSRAVFGEKGVRLIF